MKVTNVESFIVNGGDANLVFVKVSTDEGITGAGECTLESKELAVVGAIEECKRTLIGKNPLEIERIWVTWNRTFPWKGAVVFTAMNGLENALWDIAGKVYGQPVYRLLGGPVRDSVRAYTWPGPCDSLETLAGAALKAREEYGFTAFKIDPFKDFVTIDKSELRDLERCMAAL